MAKKISQLTEATSISAADEFEINNSGTSKKVTWSTMQSAVSDPYIKLSETLTAGTDGGTFTAGAWQTRSLNTEDSDTDNNCTLASNQFTLAAGTYRIIARAPAYKVNSHKAKLYNVTDTADELLGSNAYTNSADAVVTDSLIQGQFTIASSKVFEVQHRCEATKATNGFGTDGLSVTNTIYTVVELWKVS